jgi:iron(III) transport system permease protein
VLAYMTVRRRFTGRWMIDLIVMMPFLLPGIVVGVALLTAFNAPPLALSGTALILLIAFFVRRMPYVFRSSTSAIGALDTKMEEASSVMGGSWLLTFRRVTLPLIGPGVLAGAILTFTTLIGELSATMILYSAQWKTATVAIYEYLLEDKMGPASAIGAIMTLVVLAGIMLANKLLGERIGNLFNGA